MEYSIFGKAIAIKQTGCSQCGIPGLRLAPSVNLFVQVTQGCNATCLFCSNKEKPKTHVPFNLAKLFDIVQEIRSKNIDINRINVTGGEPSVVPELVSRILDTCHEKT